MSFSDTLVIRNIPAILSDHDKEQFLKYFGALNVTVLNSSHRKKSTAFAKFESPEVASAVLFRLHQKELLGYRLSVEFTESKDSYLHKSSNKGNQKSSSNDNCYEEFLQELNSWTKGINLKLPPPYHMRYRYPVPTSEVLHNICNMLATVPKLYTQVLHLMNKMNLPCPFESDFPIEDHEIFDSFLCFIYEKFKQKMQLNDSDSEVESELESDGEKKSDHTSKRKTVRQKKLVKRPRIMKPTKPSTLTTTSKVSINVKDVFETVNKDVTQNRIELNVPEKIEGEQHRSAEETEKCSEIESTGFGILYPVDKEKKQEKDVKNEESDNSDCISAEKLASNRISARNRDMLPVYKHYQPGNPSCRLYIKNLSRQVTRDDLLYIYKRYFIQGIDEQGTMFDIRLMQEGRMKGQAFVTLQSVKQAQLALDETNGYILKDKPMVVQFARSALVK